MIGWESILCLCNSIVHTYLCTIDNLNYPSIKDTSVMRTLPAVLAIYVHWAGYKATFTLEIPPY